VECYYTRVRSPRPLMAGVRFAKELTMCSRLVAYIALLLLSLSCSGFHDRSFILSTYEQLEQKEILGLGNVSIETRIFIDDKALSQSNIIVCLKSKDNKIVRYGVSNYEGNIDINNVPPGNEYYIEVYIECWETSWHRGYDNRTLTFPLEVKEGSCTKLVVTIDCPSPPMTLT